MLGILSIKVEKSEQKGYCTEVDDLIDFDKEEGAISEVLGAKNVSIL